jgi:hypothetical protein
VGENLAFDRLLSDVLNVCFWHKADITIMLNDVRFWGNSGHCDEPTYPR